MESGNGSTRRTVALATLALMFSSSVFAFGLLAPALPWEIPAPPDPVAEDAPLSEQLQPLDGLYLLTNDAEVAAFVEVRNLRALDGGGMAATLFVDVGTFSDGIRWALVGSGNGRFVVDDADTGDLAPFGDWLERCDGQDLLGDPRRPQSAIAGDLFSMAYATEGDPGWRYTGSVALPGAYFVDVEFPDLDVDVTSFSTTVVTLPVLGSPASEQVGFLLVGGETCQVFSGSELSDHIDVGYEVSVAMDGRVESKYPLLGPSTEAGWQQLQGGLAPSLTLVNETRERLLAAAIFVAGVVAGIGTAFVAELLQRPGRRRRLKR